MKKLAILFVVLLVLPAAACAQQVVREMRVTLQLDVDANGQVTAVKPMAPPQLQTGVDRPALPDALAKAAEQVASKWRFKAPTIHGRPVAGRTWAYANLQIIKQGGSTYAVHVQYKRNGPHITRSIAPQYPLRMRRAGHYAAVFIHAVVQPDGSISNIRVLKVYSDAHHGKDGFARAAEKAIKHWRAQAEHVDGHAVATNVFIPIIFRLGLGYGNQKVQDEFVKSARKKMQAQYGYTGSESALESGAALVQNERFVKLPSS